MKSFQMHQPERLRFELSGASSSELVDCSLLARQAWGSKCHRKNSGLTAFSYLWRRFGPPWFGSDPHKRLVSYILSTPEPDVFLTVDPSGSAMYLNVGYLVRRGVKLDLYKAIEKWEEAFGRWFIERNPSEAPPLDQRPLYWKWRHDRHTMDVAQKQIGAFPKVPSNSRWKSGPPVMRRVNQALLDAMLELLRPVSIRDVPINLFGRFNEEWDGEKAEPSKYAGYGVPLAPMRRYLKGEQK